MKTINVVLFAIGVLTLAVGCTPSPEKVCAKSMELHAKDKEKDAKADPKRDEEELKACAAFASALKEADGDVYKCFAKCTMDASDRKADKECQKGCKGADEVVKKVFEKMSKGSK